MTSPILNSDHSIIIFYIKFLATLRTHFHILKKVLFSGSSLIIGIFICLLLESFQILSLFFRYGWSCSWWEIDLRFNHNKHFLFLESRSWLCLNPKSWSWSLILILDPFFSFQTWQQIDLRFDRKKHFRGEDVGSGWSHWLHWLELMKMLDLVIVKQQQQQNWSSQSRPNVTH